MRLPSDCSPQAASMLACFALEALSLTLHSTFRARAAWKASRKERQDLLRVVAQTSVPIEKEACSLFQALPHTCPDTLFTLKTHDCKATLNFQMPSGSQAASFTSSFASNWNVLGRFIGMEATERLDVEATTAFELNTKAGNKQASFLTPLRTLAPRPHKAYELLVNKRDPWKINACNSVAK